MSRIIREIDRGTRTVDGIEVHITELVWQDEGRNFEVHRTDTGADLTEDGCFDTWPTDDQITDLLRTAQDLWSCPGCGTSIDASQADLIVDHVRDCDRVDGAGHPRTGCAMSGRVAPQDVVAALYRAADDDRLPWLDELMIAAGFLRRCPCGATAPADERCDQCGLSDDEPAALSYFEVYRCEPEATYTVAALADGDPPLQIRIAAVGGGTVGVAYADNDWIYEVHLAGTLVCSGVDLHSGGFARTTRRWRSCSPNTSPTPTRPRRCTAIGSDSATGPTTPSTAVDAMSDDPSATVTDERHPGWRARLIHDDCAGEPDGDALAPALLASSRGRPRPAKGVYLPGHAEQILAAWLHLADRDRFCRYLRRWHGVTAITVASTADLDVIIFDTADYRDHVGMQPPADLSAERGEWQAWLDGDVYGVQVQRHHSGTTTWDDNTTTATWQWREVDAVRGLYGHAYATRYAHDLLHDCAAG